MDALATLSVLPSFDEEEWLRVAVRTPEDDIQLSPEEKKEYLKVKHLVLNRHFLYPDLLKETVFGSDNYTYNFKYKLAMRAFHPEANLWAFNNLTSQDLFVFLSTDYYHSDFRQKSIPDEVVTQAELEALADNPHFLQSLGTQYDSLRLIFFIFQEDLNPDGLLPLVNILIQRKQMSVVIAHEILKNVFNDFKLLEYPVDDYEVVGVLTNWVAEHFGLEDLPTQWVLQFVHSTLSDK